MRCLLVAGFGLFTLAALLFSACQDDEKPYLTQNFSKGVLVVNEGPFGGTGTITWHDPNTGETAQDVFGKANGGAALGQFVQSYTVHNRRGYAVVNGADKIVVVDAETFKYIDTIGGLALPRYFLPLDDKYAYVTQWGPDGKTGSVAKIDLKTLKVVKTIPTGSGAEKMCFTPNKDAVWVANSGGFGLDSAITTFNVADEVPVRIVLKGQRNPCCVAYEPSALKEARTVLCTGDYTQLSSKGWIGDPFGSGYVVSKGANDLCFARSSSQFLFTDGLSVYRFSANGPAKLFDQKTYGLNCDPTENILYCADPKDFNSNGEVFVRRADGSQIGVFPCGIAPGEVVVLK